MMENGLQICAEELMTKTSKTERRNMNDMFEKTLYTFGGIAFLGVIFSILKKK